MTKKDRGKKQHARHRGTHRHLWDPIHDEKSEAHITFIYNPKDEPISDQQCRLCGEKRVKPVTNH